MDSVRVFGQLDVLVGDQVKRSYRAIRSHTASPPWFYGYPETMTELRRKALLEVKEDIEQQMLKDPLLTSLR